MGYIKVKNKNNTSNKIPPKGYGSWLAFWEDKTGIAPKFCKMKDCTNDAEVGGHVIKAGEGAKEYILPICKSCNNQGDTEEFEAEEGDLVSVAD